MNKNWKRILFILALAVILFFVRRYTSKTTSNPKKQETTNNNRKTEPSEVNRNRGFDRRVSYIEYTEHAKCRMQCRKISQAEVEEIMKEGKINYAKSDVEEKPCPVYALEGVTNDNQRVRIVFAQCDFKTKVVTAIDLETEWECHCPGDDSKHKNRR